MIWLVLACSGRPVEPRRTTPDSVVKVVSANVRATDRVVVFATMREAETPSTSTLGGPCLGVADVRHIGGEIELRTADTLPVIPSGSELRAGRCGRDGMVAMPMTGPGVAAIRPHLGEGSQVDVLVTLEGEEEWVTKHLVLGARVDDRGDVEVTVENAQRLAHVAAMAAVTYTLVPRAEEGAERLESILPEGMRGWFVPGEVAASVRPFAVPGDYVDVVAHVEDADGSAVSVLRQALMVLGAPDDDEPDSPLALLVTQHLAEELSHAWHLGSIDLLLRHPDDASDRPVAPIRSDERDWSTVVVPERARLAKGLRGFVVAAPGVEPGPAMLVRASGEPLVRTSVVGVREARGLVVLPAPEAATVLWLQHNEGPVTAVPLP